MGEKKLLDFYQSIINFSGVGGSAGVYKVPHPPPGGGEFIKFFGEEFQIVKRGREFKGFYLVGKGTEILGKKTKNFKNGGLKEYQIVGNFIRP